MNRRHTDFQSVALPTELPAPTVLVSMAYVSARLAQTATLDTTAGRVSIAAGLLETPRHDWNTRGEAPANTLQSQAIAQGNPRETRFPGRQCETRVRAVLGSSGTCGKPPTCSPKNPAWSIVTRRASPSRISPPAGSGTSGKRGKVVTVGSLRKTTVGAPSLRGRGAGLMGSAHQTRDASASPARPPPFAQKEGWGTS